jgi:hypothetical protein
LEICCTLEKGTLPTPETLSVRPVDVFDVDDEPEPDDEFDDEPDVEELVEPEPPMLTLSTVPVT